jgi:hypothetical protein
MDQQDREEEDVEQNFSGKESQRRQPGHDQQPADPPGDPAPTHAETQRERTVEGDTTTWFRVDWLNEHRAIVPARGSDQLPDLVGRRQSDDRAGGLRQHMEGQERQIRRIHALP